METVQSALNLEARAWFLGGFILVTLVSPMNLGKTYSFLTSPQRAGISALPTSLG